MGYVRLKHTLSALALEALAQPRRRRVVEWLVAFCDAVDAGITPAAPPALDGLGPVASLFEWTGHAAALRPEFQPHFAYLSRQVHRLRAALASLRRERAGRTGATMRRAAALFNNGLFFECHEFLQAVWRSAPPADRDFYHGVILIAAAFYHYEKGNLHGTRVKLRQGMGLLRPYQPRAHGVRLDRWLAALEPWRARVEAGQSTGVLAPDDIPAMGFDRVEERT